MAKVPGPVAGTGMREGLAEGFVRFSEGDAEGGAGDEGDAEGSSSVEGDGSGAGGGDDRSARGSSSVPDDDARASSLLWSQATAAPPIRTTMRSASNPTVPRRATLLGFR
ncbi:hypothetical protein GCM10009801_41750 [Streptomyces albiaxialis]|uniref:Uncharacterized protein n=1 Tax=Streptomyces albiaxialis TaxID=329523 RepID=A0ABN2W344_9ACTN